MMCESIAVRSYVAAGMERRKWGTVKVAWKFESARVAEAEFGKPPRENRKGRTKRNRERDRWPVRLRVRRSGSEDASEQQARDPASSREFQR